MTLDTLVELALLWGFLALSVALVGLAVLSRRLEREEGLPRSRYRLPLALAACAAVAALVVGATVISPAPATDPTRPPAARPVDTPALSPEAQQQVDALTEQRKALYAQTQDIDAKIQALKNAPAAAPEEAAEPPAAESRYRINVRAVARYLVPLLLLASVVLLVFVDDPGVLLRLAQVTFRRNRGELQQRAVADLNGVAGAAEQGRYAEGLAAAERIDPTLLDRFDRYDWLYLKSYCGVQVAAATNAAAERARLLEAAVQALAGLAAEVPDRGEVVYLKAVACGLLGRNREAADLFAQAQPLLPANPDLPFAGNRSVVLLNLAEEKLGTGDADEAGRLFDEVARLKVLGDRVPTALVKVRLQAVRRSLQGQRYADAAAGVQIVRALPNLDAAQQATVSAICDALDALVRVKSGDAQAAGPALDEFLARHLPPNLPVPDDAIADEFHDEPLADVELRLAPGLFRSFLLLQAEQAAKEVGRAGRPPTVDVLERVLGPLRRALQFELRQRDALAALGVVTYWFVPEKRAKAQQWLEAAVALGVEGRAARRLLDRTRHLDEQNREALAWFRTTGVRFLSDPSVNGRVRHALVEELGRFRGFEPLLLDLEADITPQEPTLRLLRDRAGYVRQMVDEYVTRKPGPPDPEFDHLRSEYAALAGSFEASADRLAELERRLVQTIGKSVLM